MKILDKHLYGGSFENYLPPMQITPHYLGSGKDLLANGGISWGVCIRTSIILLSTPINFARKGLTMIAVNSRKRASGLNL